MNKSTSNEGARQVKKMVEAKESLRSILAFAEGFGFDLNSYSSGVRYINEKLSITIRRENFYFNL